MPRVPYYTARLDPDGPDVDVSLLGDLDTGNLVRERRRGWFGTWLARIRGDRTPELEFTVLVPTDDVTRSEGRVWQRYRRADD